MPTSENGNASFKGWHYQKQASAWLLVELLVVHRWCSTLILEPDTQEDLEAPDGRSEPETQPSVGEGSGARLSGSNSQTLTLDVQVKQRSRVVWTPATLRSVLTEGESKEPAAQRLQRDPHRHWLLITNADVNSDLAAHVVKTWRPTTATTATFADAQLKRDYPDIAPRVHLLPNVDAHVRALRVLQTECRVLEDRREACLDALCQLVEAAWLGRRSRELSAAEVVDVLRQFGGCPPELARSDYVPPAEFQAAVEKLDTHRVLVLVGPPGVGKSTVAEQIRLTLQRRAPPVQVVVRDDPFGAWEPDSDAPAAVKELEAVLRDQHHPHRPQRLVYTTRPEWLDAAFLGRVPKTVEAVCVGLSSESYHPDDKWKLLLAQLDEPWKIDWVATQREQLEAELSEPMAFMLYGADLRSCPDRAATAHDAWIENARVANVRQHVATLVHGGRPETAVADAMALWLRLSAPRRSWDEHTRTVDLGTPLDALRNLLRKAGVRSKPAALRDRLLAAGRLQGSAGAVSAHPEVLRGLQQVLEDAREDAETVVLDLMDATVDDTQLDVLLPLLTPIRRWLGKGVPSDSSRRISSLLEGRLLARSSDLRGFGETLSALGRHGDRRSPIARLAHALHDPAREPNQWYRTLGFSRWSPPQWSAAERAEVAESPEAERVAAAFIRDGLADGLRFGDGSLARFFRDLGWGATLAPVFREAMESQPYVTSSRDMMLGALEADDVDVDAELVEIDRALSELVHDHEEIWQLEVDASHVERDRSDVFAHYESRVLAIVERERERRGWRWLSSHPSLARLVDAWAHLIREESGPSEAYAHRSGATMDLEELAALWAVLEHAPEQVAQACMRAAPVEVGAWVTDMLLEEPGPGYRVRARAALAALLVLPGSGEPGAALLETVAGTLTEVAIGILNQELENPPSVDWTSTRTRTSAYLRAIGEVREADWCLQVEDAFEKHPGWPHPPRLDFLDQVDETSRARLRIYAAAACPRLHAQANAALALLGEPPAVAEISHHLVASGHDPRVALLLVTIAGMLGSDGAEVVRSVGLKHRDYRVRQRAIRLSSTAGVDTRDLLPLANDRSGPVRAAVAEALSRRPVEGDREVLLALALDSWNADPYAVYGESPEYVVARAALAALEGRLPLAPSERARLETRLAEGIAQYESDRDWDRDDWTFLKALQDLLERASAPP